MIELVIFYLHVIAAAYAFTKSWQQTGLKSGILSVALIGLVFVIGWSMTAALANLVLPNTWRREWFTSDTLALIMLAIPEYVFFRIFFLKTNDVAETQPHPSES